MKWATDNERFGVMAAEARRNGSGNLKVCTPQEVQWKPPLRQATTTLVAMRAQPSLCEFSKKKNWYNLENFEMM